MCTREQIIEDYNNLAIPLDMIAKKNEVSLHFVISTVYYWTVLRPKMLLGLKEMLKDI